MRIATGGIIHETSTCVDTSTTMADFEHDRGVVRGDAVPERFRGTNVQTGGFIAAADEYGFELVPLLRASAFPGGLIRRADYDALKSEMLERLRSAGPVDGVLLELHGAMVVDGIDDGDGDVIASVREVVGPDVPIGVPQDLHGNHTKRRVEDGCVGIGASTGGEAAAFIIEQHLSMFVEGRNVRDRSVMWEQMWRASIHYSRKGLGVHAISAIDIALWDLFGKTMSEPVYNLMGGRTKQRVSVYATTSRPDLAKEMGFRGAKVPLPYGPSAGSAGMRKNVEFVGDWREKVGQDFALMLDCYMALDWQYAAELARRLEPFHLTWIEEPLMPDEYAAHAKLAKKLEGQGGTAYFATGEHEYTRYGFQQLIEAGVGLLQPDVMWMGGPTEFARVVAQANAQAVAVVPHGCGVYGYYMAMAFESISLAKFMMMSEKADKIEPNFGTMFKNEPLPEDGYITLPDTPGFGLELNREALNLVRPYAR